MGSKGRVVIKLGGGLITDKSKSKTLDKDAIEGVCIVLKKLQEDGYPLIIVHGAGSFGHILSKEMKIADGIDKEILNEQKVAVKQIREDMQELNREIINSMNKFDLNGISFPPSKWANGVGINFKGDLAKFERNMDEEIPICYGDVVDRNDEYIFGILSGDDLMYRLSLEVPNVEYSIFLLGDVSGVLDKPPNDPDSKLLETWSEKSIIGTIHDSEVDVTGGINLKLNRASGISKKIDEVWFIDGRRPERILELIREGRTLGTKIIP